MSVPKLSSHAFRSLARALSHPLSLRGNALGPSIRERIILRVSSINGCTVCSAVHGAVARVGGLTHRDIHRARTPTTDEDLDEDTKLLLHYAEIRTARLENDFPQVVHQFDQRFDGDIKREVRAIVDLFTFNNRFNNTWEAFLPGAARRRQAMGLVGPS